MRCNILYTADLHGNEVQYQKLIRRAIETSVDAVIIGGDLAPKGESTSAQMNALEAKGLSIDAFIGTQRLFFEEHLPELVRPLKEQSPKTRLFIIMGNDDCAANLDVLNKYNNDLYHLIHGKRMSLTRDFDLVGYSYVPITPFGIKDWEKFDLSKIPSEVRKDYEQRKATNYQRNGMKSALSGWIPFKFSDTAESEDSIQTDLATKLFTQNPQKTVYVIHTPPNNTNLDQISGRRHVGSFAVRLFVEQCKPYLTLHGHIHETVNVSGSFKDLIRDSLCLSPGNDHQGNDLYVLSFDLYDRTSIRRWIL